MSRIKTVKQYIEWLIAAAAYGYLAYRLVVYDQYDALWTSLRTMSAAQWTALALCIALMPVNMLIEAWRWQTLVPMTLNEAQRQVYYSRLAAIITPWHMGEYPARGMMMGNMSTGLSMGVVGSMTMTGAIISIGIIALTCTPAVLERVGGTYLYTLLAALILLAVGLYATPRILKKYATIRLRTVLISLGQSVVRVACWCIQLGLVLYALDNTQDIIHNAQITLLPIYYLLVTITPNIPIVEVGVRGAWAMFLFGTPNAALAGVLLWTINTLLPCVGWLLIRNKNNAIR